MDINLDALKAVVYERDLSWEMLIAALEEALLVAYQKTNERTGP